MSMSELVTPLRLFFMGAAINGTNCVSFMRKNESLRVEKALEVLGLHLRVVNASSTFMNATTTIRGKCTSALCETVLPEEKRKIIGTCSEYLYVDQPSL